MKVYIVTDGCYSDYTIVKVFSNRPIAEDYKKWHNITNDIEEYDVCDETFEEVGWEKCVMLRVQGTVYPEAVVDLTYDIRYQTIHETYLRRGAGIHMSSKKPGVFDLYYYRHISADKWDEEKYKAKFTKALYDLASIAKAMFAEGASVRDVEQAIRNTAEED
jgi:hypothetical protein